MSGLAMILTAAMAIPGDGPEKVSGEIVDSLRFDGIWRGTIQAEEEKHELEYKNGIMYERSGAVTVTYKQCVFIDEGHGRASVSFRQNEPLLGIYKRVGEKVIICLQKNNPGRASSFDPGNGQVLLILHRIKSRK